MKRPVADLKDDMYSWASPRWYNPRKCRHGIVVEYIFYTRAFENLDCINTHDYGKTGLNMLLMNQTVAKWQTGSISDVFESLLIC